MEKRIFSFIKCFDKVISSSSRRWRKMAKMYPKQSLDTLTYLTILTTHGSLRHWSASVSRKHSSSKSIHLIPVRNQRTLFIRLINIFLVFHITMLQLIARLQCSLNKPHPGHNSLTRFDEGAILEPSALKSPFVQLVAKLRIPYQLS